MEKLRERGCGTTLTLRQLMKISTVPKAGNKEEEKNSNDALPRRGRKGRGASTTKKKRARRVKPRKEEPRRVKKKEWLDPWHWPSRAFPVSILGPGGRARKCPGGKK